MVYCSLVLFFLVFMGAECDAITGCKISSINIGAPVVTMSYSPTSGHAVIAILEVSSIYVCLFRMFELC